jgi:hypothetical protein
VVLTSNASDEMIGRKHGRFTVRGPADKKAAFGKARLWRCECECGAFRELPTSTINAGKRWLDCGCVSCGPKTKGWKGCGDLSGAHWRRIVNGAKARDISLTITIEDAWDCFLRQEGRCSLTGLPLVLVTNQGKAAGIQTASLDRRDSLRGYEPDNIQWVHRVVNMMKLDHSEEEFIRWCRLVADHNPLRSEVAA